jgi:chromatin remodeling complex protein RSC6
MSEQNTTPAPTLNLRTLHEHANDLEAQAKLLRAMAADLRKQARQHEKDIKEAQKKKNKRVKDPNAPKRAPAGFARPTLLSEELCKFLNVPADEKIARTDVTKLLTKYIKDNNLQNPENRKEINMDAKLKKLLNPPDNVVVTFFTLQTYMKPHFIKDDKSDSTPVEKTEPVVSEPVVSKKKVVVKKKLDASSGGRRVAA